MAEERPEQRYHRIVRSVPTRSEGTARVITGLALDLPSTIEAREARRKRAEMTVIGKGTFGEGGSFRGKLKLYKPTDWVATVDQEGEAYSVQRQPQSGSKLRVGNPPIPEARKGDSLRGQTPLVYRVIDE